MSELYDFFASSRIVLQRNVWLFPLAKAVLFLPVTLACLFTALAYGQMEPWLPYISDAGSLHPQAAFFSLMLVVCALFGYITTSARYEQIQAYIEKLKREGTPIPVEIVLELERMNKLSSVGGYSGCLWMAMIGLFRSNEYVFFHIFAGTWMVHGKSCFFFYQIKLIETLNQIKPIESRPRTMKLSFMLSVLLVVIFSVASLVSIYQFGWDNVFHSPTRLAWNDGQRGHRMHFWAALVEWAYTPMLSLQYWCLARRMGMTTRMISNRATNNNNNNHVVECKNK